MGGHKSENGHGPQAERTLSDLGRGLHMIQQD